MDNNRFTLFASVHILFLKEGKILLSLRKNVSSNGLYGLVAGHIDGGETVTQTIIRETKEEAGIDLKPEDFEITTVCHSFSRHNQKEFIQFYAVCKSWQGEIVNNEPEKCSELKFFPVESLPQNIVPYLKDAINKVIKGVKFYEYGWQPNEE